MWKTVWRQSKHLNQYPGLVGENRDTIVNWTTLLGIFNSGKDFEEYKFFNFCSISENAMSSKRVRLHVTYSFYSESTICSCLNFKNSLFETGEGSDV